jgi:hypothetical protein
VLVALRQQRVQGTPHAAARSVDLALLSAAPRPAPEAW